MRRVMIAGVTVAIGLFIGLVGAEILTRLVWKPPMLRSTPVAESHPYYREAARPGVTGMRFSSEFEYRFSHSSQGMRGTKVFSPKRSADTRRRVLFLGDSFTYGVGVADEDVFVDVLRRKLPGVEIINAGFTGYGQREQLAVLDQLGPALRPDLMVVVFFWNDLGDNHKRTSPAFEFDEAGTVVRTDLVVPNTFDPLAPRVAEPIDMRALARRTSYLKRLYRGGIRGLRYRLFGIRPRFPTTLKERDAGWSVTRPYLAMLKARARELGSDFLLISIPGQDRIDPDSHIDGIEPLAVNVEESLAAVTSDLGIEYWDTLDELRDMYAIADERFYYFADRHLTARGNHAVADVLTRRFRDRFGDRLQR